MAGERPINADVPRLEPPDRSPAKGAADGMAGEAAPPQATAAAAGKAVEATGPGTAAKGEPKKGRLGRARRLRGGAPRRRAAVPWALKLSAALVAIAAAFAAIAIVGGSGSPERGGALAPAGSAGAVGPAAVASLGSPALATKNTTRIGGSELASRAAQVALTTFPSATPSQRPPAVTLVGEGDWAGAIAASVLTAAPLRAPILLSSHDGLPEPTLEALAALQPAGDPESDGARAFAIGDVEVPGQLGKVTAVPAAGAAAEAAAIMRLRDRLAGAAPRHIVIASAGDSAMAMPAAAWAARSGDPVLFARRGRLPPATAAALRSHQHVPVYVLGPSTAISSTVVRRIAALGLRVRRVSGPDPVANAVAFARYVDGDFGWNVNDPGHGFVVARSDSPLDAAAAAPLSASGTWGPLLLTDSAGTLPTALREYLLDVKPGYTTDPTRAFYNHVWVIGDQETIDVNQQAEIDELAELAKIGGEP